MRRDDLEETLDRFESGRLSRRQFLGRLTALGLSASAAGSLLSACGGSGGGGGKGSTGTIKIAAYSYIPANLDLQGIAKQYQDKNKNIKIEISTVPDTLSSDLNAFVQKFVLEGRRNKASYDLIFGPTPWVEVAPLAQAKALAPLDDYLPKDLVSDMPEPVRTGNTYQDGKIYGLPVWTDVVGFISRKDMLKKALGSTQPPGTWDQVLSMSRSLKGKLPSRTYPYGADWTYFHRMFLPIFVTMTGNPWTDKGLANLDDPGALEALKLIKELVPFMPPNANQDLGSSSTFQAKKLAMESYWQAQLTRATTAGVPADAITMSGNPKGNRESTVFWTTDVVVQAGSPNKEEAVKFWVDGVLKNPTFQKQSVHKAGKILPYNSMLKSVPMPGFMQPLSKQLVVGSPIPMNSAFEQVEYPQFKEQAERMVLKGQSPEETLANLKKAFAEYQGG